MHRQSFRVHGALLDTRAGRGEGPPGPALNGRMECAQLLIVFSNDARRC
jgi:hypothetical protein